MGQKVVINRQESFLDFVVITLEKKGYDALLEREWLITMRITIRKKTLSIRVDEQKYTIDLRTQTISQQLTSTDLEVEGEDGEGVKLNEEGTLRLRECSEDETSSLNGLFHMQIGDYQVFQL